MTAEIKRWPHQVSGVEQVIRAREAGERIILMTSPTGGGKSVMMCDLIDYALTRFERSVMYTNRKMLTEQTARVMNRHGISHGVRSSGWDENLGADVQIASMQTENSRTKRGREVHDATLVLVDEAHLQKGEMAERIYERHLAQGATIVLVTATPIDMGSICGVTPKLVVAGRNSELRRCGALVPAMHFGCDEPDRRKIRKSVCEYTENDVRKLMMVHGIFGRVMSEYERLNPDHLPTLLFAPGVAESIWFAEQFRDAGIKAAHIDGKDCWVDGEFYKSSREIREQIIQGTKDNDIKVLCNRFVLREAIDLPWMRHGIFATVFSTLQSYIQSGGRLLRAYPGKQDATIQDHGGCLDDQTEVLTKRGWLSHYEIDESDMVAGFDLKTSEISWQPILHKHVRQLETHEEMYAASGRQCNIRVTGNHRIAFKKRTCDKYNNPFWPNAFSFKRADVLNGEGIRFKIPISGQQKADGVDLSDSELSIIGWFLSDGCLSGHTLSFSQANHQPQINDLRQSLTECGFNFRESPSLSSGFPNAKPATVFFVPKGNCPARPRNGWIRLSKYLDKNFSPELEELTERQFGILLYAIHLGNGDKNRNKGAYRISTGNKIFADRIQSMCIRRGWKCTISIHKKKTLFEKGTFVLNIQKRNHLIIHGNKAAVGQTSLKKDKKSAGELVWCVANPLETLVTRRYGKVAIIGNSWHLHGSLNADRDWESCFGYSENIIQGMREERMRNHNSGADGDKEPEPFICPRCKKVIITGTCGNCGFRITTKARPVVQADGTIKMHEGDIYQPHRVKMKNDTMSVWERCYYRAKNSKNKMTFRQAVGLFYYENYYYPPRDLPLMPTNAIDWYRSVADVSIDRLYSKHDGHE